MEIKLSPEQRQRANELVDQIIDDPEKFAFELVFLRDLVAPEE